MDRPELTTLIPADPRVLSLPQGECIVSLRDGGLWIEHADPRVMISLELLDEIVRGDCHPQVTIRPADEFGDTWVGALLRIEAENQTVLYRLAEYVAPQHGWIMEWPD
jgi:hypothetical protein